MARAKVSKKKLSDLETLTVKQRKFVNTLLEMEDPDPRKAAELSGYRASQGNSLARNPKVYAIYKKRLEDRNKKSVVTGERIIEEIAALAFLDPTELFYDKKGMLTVKSFNDLTPLQRKLIDKVVISTEKGAKGKSQSVTVTSITSDVKLKALTLLMKHKGMLIDKRQEEHVHKINWDDYYKARKDDAEKQLKAEENDVARHNMLNLKALPEPEEDEITDAEYSIEELLDPEEPDMA